MKATVAARGTGLMQEWMRNGQPVDPALGQILDRIFFTQSEYDSAGRGHLVGQVAEVVCQLFEECQRRGLTLSRWQSNQSRHDHSVTWAIHTGERAAQARHQPNDTIRYYAQRSVLEGKTVRSEWGRILSGWLDALREMEPVAQ